MIEFKNIEVKFDNFVAIKDINISVNEGEFFTLLGPSGCGKTTTLRTLVGFNVPSKGRIYLNEQDITDIPVEKRGISMVFQSYALFPTLSVYENIAFGIRVQKLKGSLIDEMVKDIAKKVDLSDEQLQKKVSELSGGQQQRVAIARALVTKPKILVLDEPLSNLDAKLRVQLRNELKILQKKFGITTIYVTHDQEEALTLSDRIAVFNQGVIEQIGTPEEIYNQSKTPFVCNFIGDINPITSLVKNDPVKRDSMKSFDEFFVRLEKVETLIPRTNGDGITSGEDNIQVSGTVIEKEFYGLYTKYSYKTKDGILVKTIETDTKYRSLEIGDEIGLRINLKDILMYKKEGLS